jgi:D-alanyl-lipoteichoic acid acyltransferase DltB (MBOAT superfamily)
MLFNSIPFIFVFLPLVIAGFFLVARVSHYLAAQFLLLASLFFYGWWDSRYLFLLSGSILFNFYCGNWIVQALDVCYKRAKRTFVLAVVANLALLAYYKYANFFLLSINDLTGSHWQTQSIILPLGISFFTFTQIAYLADCLQGKVRESRFAHYSLFVTYFPHLIAGPVLHHKEMMPQFALPGTYQPSVENFAVGITIFCLGLFKKVVLADGIAPYVGPVFSAAAEGRALGFVDANCGAVSYALQLYFDFSGYSDMAIGISRMFGIVLPSNFQSPYKAVNIIDFWRRWHITLSRFLRDYLYIPLGGNRSGKARRHLNLMITMLLGGLWHGAAWTFVVWGGLHGLMLMINHAWRAAYERCGYDLARSTTGGRLLGIAVTFYCVVVAWVFFRAPSIDSALLIVRAMLGFNGVSLPDNWLPATGPMVAWLQTRGFTIVAADTLVIRPPLNWFPWLLAVVWLLPNTQQFMVQFRPVLDPILHPDSYRRLTWKPSLRWASVFAICGFVGIVKIGKISEFLYFQF